MAKRKEEQREPSIATTELPKSPGQWFRSRLNKVLREVRFDQTVEELCEPYYSSDHGRPSIPSGVYFRIRMLLLAYFAKSDLQSVIAWRSSDSLSLREFLGLAPDQASSDHSSLTRIRTGLPVAIHKQVLTDATILEALGTLGIGEPSDESSSDDEPIALRSRQERQEDIGRGVGILETVTPELLYHAETTNHHRLSSLLSEGSARGRPPTTTTCPLPSLSFSGLKDPGAFRPEFFECFQ